MEQREVEIDLIDFVFYVLSHWRSMIACVVIGAVVGAGLGVLKESPSFEKEYTAEECLEELKDTEIADVKTAVLYADLMKQHENDPLMKLDAKHVAEGTLLMSFSSSDETRAKAVYNMVDQLLDTKEFYQFVKEKENYSGDVSQLLTNRWIASADSDLLDAANIIAESTNDNSHVYLYSITTFGVDEEFCQRVLDDIKEYLDGKKDEIVRVYGSYDTQEVNRYIATIEDQAVSDMQVELNENYATMKKNQDALTSGFNDYQKAYYEMLVPPEEEATSIVAYLKWVIIGAFLLFAVWGFYFLMRYVFTGKWQAYHTFSGYYGLTDIALIRRADDKKHTGLDRAIIRGRLRGGRVLPMQDAIEAAASTIALRAQKDDLHRVALVGGADGVEDIFRQLADGIQQKNASVEVRILHDLPYTASAIDQLQDTDAVVVVETAGVTNRAEMTKELTLLANQKMNILGGITIA